MSSLLPLSNALLDLGAAAAAVYADMTELFQTLNADVSLVYVNSQLSLIILITSQSI